MIGIITTAMIVIACLITTLEERRFVKTCKALYNIRFECAVPKEVQLENVAAELTLNTRVLHWCHGRHIFSEQGLCVSLTEALSIVQMKREHAFI